ncbi:MAG: hypothetical protein M3Y76_06980, partial [Chloroflexota bacterium]|nr:hypothetical protein [Chloroflexota bacterium]
SMQVVWNSLSSFSPVNMLPLQEHKSLERPAEYPIARIPLHHPRCKRLHFAENQHFPSKRVNT